MNSESGLSPFHLVAVGIAIGVIIGYFASGGSNLPLIVGLGVAGAAVGGLGALLLRGQQSPPDDE